MIIPILTYALYFLAVSIMVPLFLDRVSWHQRFALAVSIGGVVATGSAFGLFLIFGQGSISSALWFFSGIFIFALFIYLGEKVKKPFHLEMGQAQKSKRMMMVLGILCWVLFWGWAVREMVFVNQEGVFTGLVSNFGDLSENIAFTSYFAWGNHDLANPLYSGVLLRHHFLSNFMASLFLRAGGDVHLVFQIQTFFFGLLSTFLFGYFVKRMTGSRFLGWLAPLLLWFAGGLQWVYFLLGKEIDCPWYNFLLTRMLPQRAFLLGLPLACTVLIFLWEGFLYSRIRVWALLGFLTGLLPMANIFLFVGLAFVGLFLGLLKGVRIFTVYLLMLIIVAVPQLMYLAGSSTHSFLTWTQGWRDMGEKGLGAWVLFWFQNTGFVWPFVLLALCLKAPRREQVIFYFPFAGLFLFGNVLNFTPDTNNNYNILYVWMMGSIPVILMGIKKVRELRPWGASWVAGLMVILLMGSGALEFYKLVEPKASNYLIVSNKDLEWSQKLREVTSPDEVILIRPIHNHPVYWSGRKVLMGYPGWVWSHGWGAVEERESAARSIYRGNEKAEQFIRRYKLDGILVSPLEANHYVINQHFLDQVGREILSEKGYAYYRLNE
ncbi:MAG: hypothetical protein JW893_01140 [Candidatus Omnitrophica bacterium]|nr:hypothetical protein [Candidatus Omnitrophota bacterium]